MWMHWSFLCSRSLARIVLHGILVGAIRSGSKFCTRNTTGSWSETFEKLRNTFLGVGNACQKPSVSGLILESDKYQTQLLSQFLALGGHCMVLQASSLDRARNLLFKTPPDLYLGPTRSHHTVGKVKYLQYLPAESVRQVGKYLWSSYGVTVAEWDTVWHKSATSVTVLVPGLIISGYPHLGG